MAGCSKEIIVRPLSKSNANWYKTNKKYSFTDQSGNTLTHLFFDFTPGIDLARNEVDVVILTPEASKAHYDVDLTSGRRYLSHGYCSEEDVWKSFGENITNPPYSEAFIPRLLNQRKLPQRVLVFGEKRYLMSGKQLGDEKVKVRIVGGAVEQFCNNYPCKSQEKWNSTLILYGVSTIDPVFKTVKTVTQLRKIVDWQAARAFIENGRGRTLVSGYSYPAYRVLGDVYPSRSLRFAIEKGHLFSSKEIRTLRRSCEHIYNQIWQQRGDILSSKKLFTKSFYSFYKNNLSTFNTCMRYVRTANITQDSEQHWFFEYLKAFALASDSGFVYVCDYKSWERNVRTKSGKLTYNQRRQLKICNSESLDIMFEKAISLLNGLSTSGRSYYRYLEYDNGAYGTHDKIYGWVRDSGKRQQCQKKVSRKLSFPRDVSWKKLGKAITL